MISTWHHDACQLISLDDSICLSVILKQHQVSISGTLYIYIYDNVYFNSSSLINKFYFRFANKFKYNNVDYRVLYKAFGIRIIINVSGIAGKFNIIPLMMTIGTGFGLMSISVLVADCVMLHCTKEKAFFQKMKELDIKETIKLSENPMPNNVARV